MPSFTQSISRFISIQNSIFNMINFVKVWSGVVFKATMRVLGPIMILGANILICGIVYSFLFHIVPDLCDGNHVHFMCHVIIGFYLLGNVMFNYIACVNTSPGHPEPCHDPVKYLGGKTSITSDGKRLLHFNHMVLLEPGVSYRWCRHCKCIKPPRAHHDSITGKCVLEMDHYCVMVGISFNIAPLRFLFTPQQNYSPWMNNCVGYYNYRYFLLFMIYLFLGCIYVISVCYVQLRRFNTKQGTDPQYFRDLHDALLYAFTVAVAAMVSVGILLAWHIYLVSTNQTTIEFYINMEERADAKEQGFIYTNPFDKGWRKNWKRIFGDGSWYEVILISLRKPPPPIYSLLPEPFVNDDSEA